MQSDGDTKPSLAAPEGSGRDELMQRQRGATIWFTGLPGAGKTTLSVAVERELVARGQLAYRLDGDELRKTLCADLGFDRNARAENVRRVAHVARLLSDAGVITLVALISPYAVDRAAARQLHAERDIPFIEVHLDTPLQICQERDPKGLYDRARHGEISGLTGVDDPYEPPAAPDLRVSPGRVEDAVAAVLQALDSR